MAKATDPPAPKDDKRNAASSHVDGKFKKVDTQGGGAKWYPPGGGGRPMAYDEAVNLAQAASLLGLDPSADLSTIVAALAKAIIGLTEKSGGVL
jgi:hypothetical protein